MIVWIDAQVPRSAAAWLAEHCGVEARTLRDVGLSGSDDLVIFTAAKAAGVVLLSKDEDFVDLVARLGPPPPFGLVDMRQRQKGSIEIDIAFCSTGSARAHSRWATDCRGLGW